MEWSFENLSLVREWNGPWKKMKIQQKLSHLRSTILDYLGILYILAIEFGVE